MIVHFFNQEEYYERFIYSFIYFVINKTTFLHTIFITGEIKLFKPLLVSFVRFCYIQLYGNNLFLYIYLF